MNPDQFGPSLPPETFTAVVKGRHAARQPFTSSEIETMYPHQYSEVLDSAASVQRGTPENVMLRAQRHLGGGVYPHLLEHVGDLTHRLAEGGGTYGDEYVAPKVERALGTLRHPYGFEREMGEQIASNSKFNVERGRHPVSMDDARRLGEEYADAHEQVPVYTRPMALARSAAVALGQHRFSGAAASLVGLQRVIDSGTLRREMSQDASVKFLRQREEG
jgi:hypothetical protein